MLLAAGSAEARNPDLFARLPSIHSVRLSPDGNRAVVLRAIGESYHVTVADFTTGKSNLVMAADPEQFHFNWCAWANNERLVCSYRSYVTVRAGQITAGYRWYRDGRTTITRLLAADADGGNVLQLVPEAVSRLGDDLVWNAPDQDTIISWLPRDREHVLIQLARDDRVYPSVYRLNVYSNRLKRIERHDKRVLRWYADQNGVLRFAAGYAGTDPAAYAMRNGAPTPVDITRLGGVRPPEPLAFAAGGEHLFVAANNGRDHRAVYRLNITDASVVEPVHRDPDFDADRGLVVSPLTREPLVLQYPGDTLKQIWFDRELERTVAAVRDALPDRPSHLRLVDTDDAVNRLILYSHGNGTVPAYHMYDRAERALLLLGSQYPDADGTTDLLPARVPTRDGSEIPAYYALPGPPGNGPYPTVLMPHGGPWVRDTDDFDYWTQYLLSSGYAVVKPNYRGSSGYGDRFLADGFEQWGLRMQDDIMDALDWMIAAGHADPGRACIVGGSFGGYAALVAAYRAPERFRCAVSFAGVTDLDGLVERWRNFSLGELSVARVQTGAERQAGSPIRNVNRFGLPLLIVHGDVDRSVMIEQSRDLVAALDAAGKAYRYIEQAGGDHFLSVQSQRQEFFSALGPFLREHLAERAARP